MATIEVCKSTPISQKVHHLVCKPESGLCHIRQHRKYPLTSVQPHTYLQYMYMYIQYMYIII